MLFQSENAPPCLACMDSLEWGGEITLDYRLVKPKDVNVDTESMVSGSVSECVST